MFTEAKAALGKKRFGNVEHGVVGAIDDGLCVGGQ
jgi:hypothetical protein